MIPNFLICGACAAGCSQLTAALKQHPAIFLPNTHRPEPHYFYYTQEYSNPFSYYLNKYFSEVQDETAIGETSGSYLSGEAVPARIAKNLPHIKLIFQLRDPVERTYAGYRATAFHGLETLTFETALTAEIERSRKLNGRWKEVQPFTYIGRSMYGSLIEGFYKFFPPEQLLILKSEETRLAPDKTFRRVFEFLAVDSDFSPELPPTFTSRSVKDLVLQTQIRAHFGSTFDLLIDAIERGSDPLEYVTTQLDKQKVMLLSNNLEENVKPMSDWSKTYLKEQFYSDVKKLDQYVPFSLDDWLK